MYYLEHWVRCQSMPMQSLWQVLQFCMFLFFPYTTLACMQPPSLLKISNHIIMRDQRSIFGIRPQSNPAALNFFEPCQLTNVVIPVLLSCTMVFFYSLPHLPSSFLYHGFPLYFAFCDSKWYVFPLPLLI